MAKEETTELIVVEKATAVALFESDEAREALYEQIETAILGLPADMATKKSRDVRRSAAAQISRLKTTTDDVGAGLVEDLRAKVKAVDVIRKDHREKMDELRDLAREPLTKWEEAEKKRVDGIRLEIERARTLGHVKFGATSADIQTRIDELPTHDQAFYAEFWDEAQPVLETAYNNLVSSKAIAENAEREKAELDRQRAEIERQREAEAAQKARDDEARRLADEKAAQEREAFEREKAELQRQKDELERQRIQAEKDAAEAKERAQREADEIIAKAERETEELRKAEEARRDEERRIAAENVIMADAAVAKELVEQDASGLKAAFDAIEPIGDVDELATDAHLPRDRRYRFTAVDGMEFHFDVNFDLVETFGQDQSQVIVPREEVEDFFMWLGHRVAMLRSKVGEAA